MVKHYFKHYANFSKVVMLFYALKNQAFVIFCSMPALVGSGDKPKAFFHLLKLCLLNLNIIQILIIFKYKIRI